MIPTRLIYTGVLIIILIVSLTMVSANHAGGQLDQSSRSARAINSGGTGIKSVELDGHIDQANPSGSSDREEFPGKKGQSKPKPKPKPKPTKVPGKGKF